MSHLPDVVVWWLLVEAAGVAALPLAVAVAGSLPGRAYAYAKPLGVLVVAYLFWLGASTGGLPNSPGGVAAAFIVLTLAAWVPVAMVVVRAGRREGDALDHWPGFADLLPDRKVLIAVELVGLLVFLFALMIRARNPAILGDEKPYELMMLNATLNAPGFPPPDLWLSGFSLNYYYFGYVIVAVFAQLAGTAAGVAFNLGGALTMALAAVAAFGVGYDLVAVRRAASSQRRALTGGLGAALLLMLAGNFEVWVEAVRAINVHAGQALGQWLKLTAFTPDFQHDFWFPPAGEWWRHASLVLRDTGLAGNLQSLVTEFPMYDMLQRDVHAPVLTLWIAVLVMGLSLAVLARGRTWAVLRYGLLALALGALWAGNTWAPPPFGMLAGLAYVGRAAQRGWSWRTASGILAGLGLAVLAYVWFLPFHLNFHAPVAGISWNFFTPTSLRGLLVELGVFIPGAALLLALAHRDAPRRPRFWLVGAIAVAVVVPLVILAVALVPMIRQVAAQQGMAVAHMWGVNFQVLLKKRLAAGGAYLLITAGLAWSAVLAVLHARDRERAGMTFAVLLVVTAAFFLLVPEVVWLHDNQGWRFNTVLKFHFAAWTMLAVAVAAVLPDALAALRRKVHASRTVVALASITVLAVAMGAAYPVAATWGFMRAGKDWSLDGAAARRARYVADAPGIDWLCRNAHAGDVTVELVGQVFTDAARISVSTGLPTVLGWPGHEFMVRGSIADPLIQRRWHEVPAIYMTRDTAQLNALLARYHVRYVYLGTVERDNYPGAGDSTALDGLPVAYENGPIRIYRANAGGAREDPTRLRCGLHLR